MWTPNVLQVSPLSRIRLSRAIAHVRDGRRCAQNIDVALAGEFVVVALGLHGDFHPVLIDQPPPVLVKQVDVDFKVHPFLQTQASQWPESRRVAMVFEWIRAIRVEHNRSLRGDCTHVGSKEAPSDALSVDMGSHMLPTAPLAVQSLAQVVKRLRVPRPA